MSFPNVTPTANDGAALTLLVNNASAAGWTQPSGGLSPMGYIAHILANLLTDLPVAIRPVPIKWTQNTTSGATTAAAGDLTGAMTVVLNITAVGAANYTTRTAAQMIADAALAVGQVYKVVIVNTNAGTTTLVGGSNVTITGTATIAQNISRQYMVTVNTSTTMTFQEMYSGAQ